MNSACAALRSSRTFVSSVWAEGLSPIPGWCGRIRSGRGLASVLCLLQRPTYGPLTPRQCSGSSRAIGPSLKTPRFGWPNPRRTCSGRGARTLSRAWTHQVDRRHRGRPRGPHRRCGRDVHVRGPRRCHALCGLAPLVVPQLKTITLGGAVSGLGIESTSFRNGLPHESVLEMDILTGTGEVLTASPDQHGDLFRAFPNSYGTLGYSVRLKIELEPVKPFVALRHLRFRSLNDMVATMDRIIATGGLDGTPIDYLDGVVFSADESYLCVGVQTSTPGPVSDYTGQQIYYRSIQHDNGEKHDRLDGSRLPLAVGHRLVLVFAGIRCAGPAHSPLWPRRYRRSSFYWKLVGYDQRFNIADRIEKRNGCPPRERVIQDVELPIERTVEFLDWFMDNVPIEPPPAFAQRCRVAAVSPPPAPHICQRRLLVVGAGRSQLAIRGRSHQQTDRAVSEMDGHKSLYSEAFYSADEFDELYGGETYKTVKKTYDLDSRLLDLYAKAVQRR